MESDFVGVFRMIVGIFSLESLTPRPLGSFLYSAFGFSQQKTFRKGVIGIDNKLMIAGNLGVSPNLAHNAVKFTN